MIFTLALLFGLVAVGTYVNLRAVAVLRADLALTQSVIKAEILLTRTEMLTELEFVRSQLADYIGNELLERRVLPIIGYKEPPVDPFRKLVADAVAKDVFGKGD
jgi:hypothetical protein